MAANGIGEYAENQFYKAEFALPYDLILAKFQQQLKDHPDKDHYFSFLLGIALGGAMSVWLTQRNRSFTL